MVTGNHNILENGLYYPMSIYNTFYDKINIKFIATYDYLQLYHECMLPCMYHYALMIR